MASARYNNDYSEIKYFDSSKNNTLDKLIGQKNKALEKLSLLKSTRSSKSTFNKERRERQNLETVKSIRLEQRHMYVFPVGILHVLPVVIII